MWWRFVPEVIPARVPKVQAEGGESVRTQDIVTKLWDAAGNGNVAIWEDGTMTVVPPDYRGDSRGRTPRVVLKPIRLVNEFELLDFALADEGLLSTIEEAVRGAGGECSRETAGEGA